MHFFRMDFAKRWKTGQNQKSNHHQHEFVLMQALHKAAMLAPRPSNTLSPAKLRQALRQAGQGVRVREIAEILSYVTSDQQYADLHGLHHIHTVSQPDLLHQITLDGATGSAALYVHSNREEEAICELMPAGAYAPVEPQKTWIDILRYTQSLLLAVLSLQKVTVARYQHPECRQVWWMSSRYHAMLCSLMLCYATLSYRLQFAVAV